MLRGINPDLFLYAQDVRASLSQLGAAIVNLQLIWNSPSLTLASVPATRTASVWLAVLDSLLEGQGVGFSRTW